MEPLARNPIPVPSGLNRIGPARRVVGQLARARTCHVSQPQFGVALALNDVGDLFPVTGPVGRCVHAGSIGQTTFLPGREIEQPDLAVARSVRHVCDGIAVGRETCTEVSVRVRGQAAHFAAVQPLDVEIGLMLGRRVQDPPVTRHDRIIAHRLR